MTSHPTKNNSPSPLNQLLGNNPPLLCELKERARSLDVPPEELSAKLLLAAVDKKFWTLSQAAAEMRVTARTVKNWIKRGLPSFQIAGITRINPQVCRAWHGA